MSFAELWGTPFYGGGGGSPDVPSRFHVAIGGRTYMLDTSKNAETVNGDIPVQRPQADTGADPGAGTLSTDGLWRRTFDTFHHAAGQTYADRREPDPARFLSSQGLDPWTKGYLSLLPAVTDTGAGSAVIALLVVNSRVYALSSSAPFLQFSTDLVTWTTVTGLPATAPTSMTTDGSNVYTAHGAAGIYTSAVTGTTATLLTAGTVSRVGYVRGRLMASNANLLYNYTATLDLIYTHPNAGFTWEGFGEGPGVLYAFGAANGRARIYRTAIKADGTALDIPVAASVPITGAAYAMESLANLGLIAGEKGWRTALYDDNGDVILGPLVETASPVRCVTVSDRYAWFGLTNYSATSTGILRADPSTDTAAGTSRDGSVPVLAWATDLMATGQGTVTAVADFAGRRVFAVTGLGTFVAHATDKVASGTIDLGLIGFGIGDLKNALFADVRHLPLPAGASVQVEVGKDGGAFQVAGTSVVDGAVSATVGLGQILAELVGIRLTLTAGATLREVTLRAAPAPEVGEIWQLPLLLFHEQYDAAGQPSDDMDVPTEREYLRELRRTQTAVTVQIGSETFVGIVGRLAEFRHEKMVYDHNTNWLGYWDGVQVVSIKKVQE